MVVADPARAALQRRTVRVLAAAQVLGGAAIGVGAAVSPLLAEEILGGDGRPIPRSLAPPLRVAQPTHQRTGPY